MTDFIAIDFETASRCRNSACALATIKVVDGIIVAKHAWLFRPPNNEYDDSCIRVHGILPEMTQNLDTIVTIHNEIMNILTGAVVVAHNASFDLNVLESSLQYYGLPIPKIAKSFCTYKMSGQKLNVCCSEYGIPLDHHDPLSDATACAHLFLKLSGGQSPAPQPPHRNPKIGFSDPNKKIKSDTLTPPDLSDVSDKDTPFYGKKLLITGTLTRYPVREELALKLRGYGADIQTAISAKTDIVICGTGAGWAKMAKIETLNKAGADILVLNETDFYKCMERIEPC